jgi:hypothetical protein
MKPSILQQPFLFAKHASRSQAEQILGPSPRTFPQADDIIYDLVLSTSSFFEKLVKSATTCCSKTALNFLNINEMLTIVGDSQNSAVEDVDSHKGRWRSRWLADILTSVTMLNRWNDKSRDETALVVLQ